MSELGDAIERLELWARGEEFDELTAVIAAARERDALAAVIEEARALLRAPFPGQRIPKGSRIGPHDWVQAGAEARNILSRTPSDALVERDARIRAEVIDWFESRAVDRYDLNWVADARARFGLTKGADRG